MRIPDDQTLFHVLDLLEEVEATVMLRTRHATLIRDDESLVQSLRGRGRKSHDSQAPLADAS